MDEGRVLAPPYTQFDEFRLGLTPPLGSILIVNCADHRAVVRAFALLASRPLWMPLVAVVEPGLRLLLRSVLSQIPSPHRWSLVPVNDSDERHRVERVLGTLHARPPVPPAALAAWLSVRLDVAELEAVIAPAMTTAATDGSPHARTIRRRLSTHLSCHSGDLRRLADLARVRRGQPTMERLAAECGSTPTRLRQRVQRGLGVSLAEFNRMPGWEWVLEAAVRMGLGAGGWGLGAGGWPKITSARPAR